MQIYIWHSFCTLHQLFQFADQISPQNQFHFIDNDGEESWRQGERRGYIIISLSLIMQICAKTTTFAMQSMIDMGVFFLGIEFRRIWSGDDSAAKDSGKI